MSRYQNLTLNAVSHPVVARDLPGGEAEEAGGVVIEDVSLLLGFRLLFFTVYDWRNLRQYSVEFIKPPAMILIFSES